MLREFLNEMRKKGWTQEAIAAKTGIRQGLISKLFNGADCYASTVIKIADAFNVSTDKVLSRDTPEKRKACVTLGTSNKPKS